MVAGAPFPWTLDPRAYPDIFRPPYATVSELVGHLAYSLTHHGLPERGARALAARWVRDNESALRSASTPDELYGVLDRFDFEVVSRVSSAKSRRRKERSSRTTRQRVQRVASDRRRAARYDPGPVTTRARGRAWARRGALPEAIYHATLFGSRVMETGLKTRGMLWAQQKAARQAGGRPAAVRIGLGGGPSDVVSFTPHEDRAVHIAAVFQAVNEAARAPKEVRAWFDRHWRPALEAAWRQLLAQTGDPDDPQRWRFVRELDHYGEEGAPVYVKELINRTAQVLGGKPDSDPAFTAPVLMGGAPRRLPPGDIGVITAYANVDQLVDTDAGHRGGFLVGGISSQGGRDGGFRVGCPPGRGQPRTAAWVSRQTERRWPWLKHAATATTTGNVYEANEIRICPQDVVVVGFKPVLDWREVLMPRRGSARRSPGAEVLEARIAAVLGLNDPFMEQRRRCVRAVFQRLEGAELRKRRGRALSRKQIDALVGRAFAICTSTLQRSGYLQPGTKEPTPKGIAASLVKLGKRGGAPAGAEPIDPAERRAEYQQILRRRRAPVLDLESLFEPEGSAAFRPLPGSRNTDIKEQLRPLRQAMDEVFTCDTAFGQCKEDYPSAGHCMLAAMVVQDLFGGEILFGRVRGVPHYWNRVGDREVDLTGDQFGGGRLTVRVKKGKLNGGGSPFAREPGEQLTQPFNKEVRGLHERFVDRLVPVLRRQGMGDWAQTLAARQAA